MTAIAKKKLTEAEYLAIEHKAEFKSEFYNGEMFTMAFSSPKHNRIKENLIIESAVVLKAARAVPTRLNSA